MHSSTAARPASAALRHAARALPLSGPHTGAARRRCFAPVMATAYPHRRTIQSSSQTSSSSSSSNHNSSTDQPGFTTVNQDEISHFDALASTWWDPHGPSRLLHLMNPLRHDFIRDCRASVSSVSSSSAEKTSSSPLLRYLDVGCGGGIFAESAARLPAVGSVTALDASASVLAVARAHLRREPQAIQSKLTYLHSSVEALAAELNSATSEAAAYGKENQNDHGRHRFDVVTAFEVLEHVEQPSAFLERCGSLVRPGGWLVMSTIARSWVSWATTVVAAEDVLGIVPRGTHDWRKYVDPDELSGWFDSRRGGAAVSGGWEQPRIVGVVYVPGLGWKEVPGSEKVGNYFFGVRKSLESW